MSALSVARLQAARQSLGDCAQREALSVRFRAWLSPELRGVWNDKLASAMTMQWGPLLVCKSSSSFEMHALTPDHAEDVTVRLLHLAIDLRCMATWLTNRTVQTPAASMCHSSNDSNNRAGMLKRFPAGGCINLVVFLQRFCTKATKPSTHSHFCSRHGGSSQTHSRCSGEPERIAQPQRSLTESHCHRGHTSVTASLPATLRSNALFEH